MLCITGKQINWEKGKNFTVKQKVITEMRTSLDASLLHLYKTDCTTSSLLRKSGEMVSVISMREMVCYIIKLSCGYFSYSQQRGKLFVWRLMELRVGLFSDHGPFSSVSNYWILTAIRSSAVLICVTLCWSTKQQ